MEGNTTYMDSKVQYCEVVHFLPIYIFSIISIKIQQFFCGSWQSDSEIYIEMQKIKNSQDNFEENNKAAALILSDLL